MPCQEKDRRLESPILCQAGSAVLGWCLGLMILKLFVILSRSVAVPAAGRAGKVPAQMSARLTSSTQPFLQTSLSPGQ